MSRGIIDKLMCVPPLRALVVCIDRGATGLMRIWSSLRLKALVRGATGPNACHWSTEIKYPDNISLGEHVAIGPGCTLGAMSPIRIGSYVRISKGAVIETAGLDLSTGRPYRHKAKPIIIEDGAWISSRCIVQMGVTIGRSAVVTPNSVVHKSLKEGVVYGGNPCRAIKERFPQIEIVA